MRDYTLYLKDISAAIDSIERFTAGMDLDTFQADDKTTSAVMRKLEVIGEAVKQIPDEIRQRHASSVAGNGGDERQVDSFLFWCRLPFGLESNQGAASSSQKGDSENSARSGLTSRSSRRRLRRRG